MVSEVRKLFQFEAFLFVYTQAYLPFSFVVTGNTKQDSPGFVKFLTNYPNLTSLALVGYRVKDATVQAVAEVLLLLLFYGSSCFFWCIYQAQIFVLNAFAECS